MKWKSELDDAVVLKSKWRFFKNGKHKEAAVAYIFLVPAFIILLAFYLMPIFYSFGLSFFSWDMLTKDPKFIGLGNYEKLLSSGELLHSLKLTVLFAMGTVIPSMLIGIVFAVLLDMKWRSITIYRSFFFAPLMTSTVAISVVWIWLYHPDYGYINEFLGMFGIEPIRWLNSSSTSLIAVGIMSIWKNIGFCVVLYLAGLQNISSTVIEAARVDGAGPFRIFRQIKMPLLTPVSFLLVILLTIEQFQTFTQVQVMTGGGPNNSSQLVVLMLWEYAFEKFQFGYSSAIAVVLFVLVMALTLVQVLFVGKKVHYQ